MFQTPIICSNCSDAYHQSHTGLTLDHQRATVAENLEWECGKCLAQQQQNTAAISEAHHIEIAEKTKANYKSNLRIMQWNADGIKIKSHELADRLKERDIDICLIQESKLAKRDNTPRMKGYKAILRTDRPTIGGGGLITYAKEDIVFDKPTGTPSRGRKIGHSEL